MPVCLNTSSNSYYNLRKLRESWFTKLIGSIVGGTEGQEMYIWRERYESWRCVQNLRHNLRISITRQCTTLFFNQTHDQLRESKKFKLDLTCSPDIMTTDILFEANGLDIEAF